VADTEDKGKPSELEVELAVADSGTVEQKPEQAQERTEPVERADDDETDGTEAAGATDEERSERAARRRRQRERKRQQEEQLFESLARQGEIIEHLVGQVQHLSQHAQGNALNTVEQTYQRARADMKTAYESGDPERVADATEALNIARLNLDAAKHRRQQPQRRQPQEGPQSRPQPNPYQAEWLSRNDWYRDPERAEDAAIAHAISQTLENVEGYAPNDPALFQELDRRLKKRGIGVPAGGTQHTPGKVIVASGQRQALGPTKGKVVISQRVQDHAQKFGIDLSDKATRERIARRLQSQATR